MNPNWNPSSLGQSSATRPLIFYNFPILTAEQQLAGVEQQLAALSQQIHGGSARASQLGPGSNIFRSFLKRLNELEQMARVCNLGPNRSIRPPLSQYEASRRPATTQMAVTRSVSSITTSFLVAASQIGQTPVSGGMFMRPVFRSHCSNLRYAVAPISPPARTLEAAPLLVAHETAVGGGGGVQGSSVATAYNPYRHLSAASEVNLLAMLRGQPPQGVKRKREEEEADRKGKRSMGAGPSNAASDGADVGGGQNGGARHDDGVDEDDVIMVDLDLKLGCP